MAVTYTPIATATINGISTYTFNSIPSTYTDLRLVFTATAGALGDTVGIRYNGDTTNLYSYTGLTGDGASASSTQAFTASYGQVQTGFNDSVPWMVTVDVMSYAGNTYKTALVTASADRNGAGFVERRVILYRSTTAISSMTIWSTGANNFSGGTVTLYGIKAA